MTNKEHLLIKLQETLINYTEPTVVKEGVVEIHVGEQGGRPLVNFLKEDGTEYFLIHEYNPSFTEVLRGKYKSPFLVYECSDGEQYCVTIEQQNSTPTMSVVNVITEKEDHDRYNAIGVHIDATLMGINQNEPIHGKVDTGAECCSLGVQDIHITKSDVDPDAQKVRFSYNERQYTMNVADMVSVQTSDGGIEYRPTVLFDVKINGHLISEVHVNLNDRTHMEYKLLIGMNLLEKSNLLIDPSITEANLQAIHDMLNTQHTEVILDGVDINKDIAEASKSYVTRRLFDMILEHPDITLRDIISMAKTDAMNAVENLQV